MDSLQSNENMLIMSPLDSTSPGANYGNKKTDPHLAVRNDVKTSKDLTLQSSVKT